MEKVTTTYHHTESTKELLGRIIDPAKSQTRRVILVTPLLDCNPVGNRDKRQSKDIKRS